MHSTNLELKVNRSKYGNDVLIAIATLVTEGRIPFEGKGHSKQKKFYEGPHSTFLKQQGQEDIVKHHCISNNSLCAKFQNIKASVTNLYQQSIPLCIEVIFTCSCKEIHNTDADNLDNAFLLEQWHFNIIKRDNSTSSFSLSQLANAIKSQLYFSQITAWLSKDAHGQIKENNIRYRLSAPGRALAATTFFMTAVKHEFPLTDLGNGEVLGVSVFNAPRVPVIPLFSCSCVNMDKSFEKNLELDEMMNKKNNVFDDRMHTSCTIKGKHRCEDIEEDLEAIDSKEEICCKRLCNGKDVSCQASTSKNYFKPRLKFERSTSGCVTPEKKNIVQDSERQLISSIADFKIRHVDSDLSCAPDKGQILLDAIERCGKSSYYEVAKNQVDCRYVQKQESEKNLSECDKVKCDMSESDIFSIKNQNNFNYTKHCDSPLPTGQVKRRGISNIDITKLKTKPSGAKQKISFDDEDEKVSETNSVSIPSLTEQAKFRRNLDNATSMVFHSRTGLPLTSSPAPVRKGKTSFDFDSSLTSVSAIRSALFSTSFLTDDESESDGSIVSPCSPEIYSGLKTDTSHVKCHRKGHASNLLGSFEESVLNGRLEPDSTVHGFTAELGASGSFVPKHMFVPVTVFFYTLADNDKLSSPYLGHINLGKKGYNIPKCGTVQVTLFNPLGTVVKMFVIMYDLSDMPPNSQTFMRQRTLYMPTNCKDTNLEWGPKWLRFLIHLRFLSSKSGKIYLHSDIRMIIFHKSDMDTATAHGVDTSYELRSFTHMPVNPKFSPRK